MGALTVIHLHQDHCLEHIYKIEMSVEGCSKYGWDYAHIEWRLNIGNILPEIITEISINVEASRVEPRFGLLPGYQDLKLAFAQLLFE